MELTLDPASLPFDLWGSPMAMQQLTLPGEIVKKHNELVRSRISITSVQGSRILAALIAGIRADEKDFKTAYHLDIKDFLPNDSGKSYTEIKAVCRELAKSFAEFEMEAPDGELVLVEFPFFSRLTYRKGKIEAFFNAMMSSSLLELQGHFTKYNLLDYLKLPSIYSQRMFEVLKSWDDKPEITISLSSMHETLNTPESFRANFAEFRRRVLEKAHKDITKETSFSYEWEPVKHGRAVTGVRFIFAKKRALPVQKKKTDNAIEKSSEKKNILYNQALACFKERGSACEGGQQKKGVCEVCLKFFRV